MVFAKLVFIILTRHVYCMYGLLISFAVKSGLDMCLGISRFILWTNILPWHMKGIKLDGGSGLEFRNSQRKKSFPWLGLCLVSKIVFHSLQKLNLLNKYVGRCLILSLIRQEWTIHTNFDTTIQIVDRGTYSSTSGVGCWLTRRFSQFAKCYGGLRKHWIKGCIKFNIFLINEFWKSCWI